MADRPPVASEPGPNREVRAMLDDRETQRELNRQLDVVRRRVGGTVERLTRATEGLHGDGLAGVPASELMDTKGGDVFQLAVRLEVALAESAEAAEKLAARLATLSAAWGLPGPPSDVAAGDDARTSLPH